MNARSDEGKSEDASGFGVGENGHELVRGPGRHDWRNDGSNHPYGMERSREIGGIRENGQHPAARFHAAFFENMRESARMGQLFDVSELSVFEVQSGIASESLDVVEFDASNIPRERFQMRVQG